MMADFLTMGNACGQNLLRLVARGNAIIAELMRLKDYIPPVYRLDSKHYVQKYSAIITDFVYFKAANSYEQKIENDAVLQELDEKLRDNYSEILSRFYLGFESIHKYVTDLNSYIDELEDETYIQQSTESLMLNEEGKQLICEAIYLYGIMLLIADCYFDGRIRERLLVSYYRYNAQRASSTRVDDVCMLLRSTGFIKGSFKRPQNYPEAYFQRVPINESLIDLAIARLRTDEIYNQTNAFPHPDHRSIALANQASMLVIILSFSPSILHTQSAVMREVVDRFFPDSWVISVYMGIVIDLWDWWSPYKAAKTALNNTLENANIKRIAQKYGQQMEKNLKKTKEIQMSLSLDESAIGSVIKFIRECNVTLHWLLLHTATPTILTEDLKRSRNLKQIVLQESKYSANDTLRLLLSTAQIEDNMKQLYKQLLQDKENKWIKNKEKCIQRINKLSDAFNGNKRLDDIEENETLEAWFKEISKHIESLIEDDGKKIMQLLQALEEVQEFHQLESNLQISQHLKETRQILHDMLRSSSMTEDTMIALNIVTDCCYAWNIMETFVPTMQDLIKQNPATVIQLKALFLKMASALEMPLLRINQARSADLASVSQYYSRELESYARRVLQIIPESVFAILADIVYLETNIFNEIPTKLYKDKIKDYAQLNERLKMAELTYSVSVVTNGMLSLRSVSLGILRVDSHRLLEDGIRQELVKKVTLALHNSLIFDGKSKSMLMNKLQELSIVMDGYRKSFQYIQDYININSLKVWHEEITYIINNAVEEECRGSSWTPGKMWTYLPEDKINAHLAPTDSNSLTFMGRLAREIMRITDPKTTIYIEHALAWFDLKTQTEVLTHKAFTMILQAIGVPGLSGLDKMISHLVAVEMEKITKFIDKGIKNKSWAVALKECETLFQNGENLKHNRGKFLTTVNTLVNKAWSSLLDSVLKVGHLQILKQKIAYELNTACKFEAKHMESALRTLNNAILFEIQERKVEWENSEFLNDLRIRLEWAGITDVNNKIYVQPPDIKNIDFVIFLFSVPQLHKLYFCKNTASLLSKKIQDPIDAVIFILGVQSVLKQFGILQLNEYVTHITEYVLSFVISDSTKMSNEFEMEIITGVHFLELFIKYAGIPKTVITNTIPLMVLDQYQAKVIK
ncbi:PREDICTED: WASH complex subunit strumpellin [Ceratosolen solmsi marchali]|uniref:WASH complex subunit strumpellin n=1 Tax=Ceratosolen solmsi marchali TaxID=326594 RepID=A0AAJ6YTN2_9HYME|nr:PREDICTED: WASH complex subunit strumpellin [Ceratosolen solmsi marchali]